MKKALLLVSLYFLGCYKDETGTVTMKFDAGRSYGGAIGTPVDPSGAGGFGENGTAVGSASGPDQPGSTVSPSGGATASDTGGAVGGPGGATGTTGSVVSGGAAQGGGSGGLAGNSASAPAGSGTAQAGRSGGNQDAGAGGNPVRDAGGGAAGATGTGASTSACVAAASGGPSGMKTGQDCVSCHASGQSPKITAGGTLYSTATGGTAISGATVTITDSKGSKIKLITGKSGNFYTGSAISFPATVEVSKCPDTVTMKATITEGGCNSCHNSSMRVHLP